MAARLPDSVQIGYELVQEIVSYVYENFVQSYNYVLTGGGATSENVRKCPKMSENVHVRFDIFRDIGHFGHFIFRTFSDIFRHFGHFRAKLNNTICQQITR